MDIHKVIGKLPRPKKGFTLPGHKYTGPYNPLDEQLDENDIPIVGQEPFNTVDAISMRHDICYRDNDTKAGKKKCDDKMLIELDLLEPKNIREKIDRSLVRKIISTKKRLGWGVVKWSNELADELHKPIRKKFQKRLVFAKNVDDIWAADLVEMQSLARFNNGNKYILMVIDVFSKYGWAVALKSKTGIAVADALRSIIKKEKKPPAMLWTDKGKEFYNKHVAEVLRKYNNIHLYSTENEEKASVVERWNRTIKTKMWKYFSANNTKRYIDILDQLIHRYNNTKHRAIGCTPTVARQPASYQHVFKTLYAKKVEDRRPVVPKFHIGDKVRIVKKKKTFEKGYFPNWTEEIFIISSVKDTKPPTYTIHDLQGESIKGSFYEAELQKSKQDIFRIEKVIKKRKRKNVGEEAYVKWKGYNSDFNSWVPVSELQKL